MRTRDLVIRGVRRAYRIATSTKFLNPECDTDRQSANDRIFNILSNGGPCMVSRFGTTELNCLNNYLCVHSERAYWRRVVEFIVGNTHTPWWNEGHFRMMSLYSGIFPPTERTAEMFSERYLADVPLIDVLGCFQYYEKYMPLSSSVVRVQLETLYPFFVERPWTRALTGKRVLVVHPFSESIAGQYRRREELFCDANILPAFDLQTYRAVQSVAGTQVNFADWFAALEFMESEISELDFDVALLGCGAYGLPLAAHIKRMGRQAVHIGGGLQLLFGIKGRRWEREYGRVLNYRPDVQIKTNYSDMFNSAWVYPAASETPVNAQKVEQACYW